MKKILLSLVLGIVFMGTVNAYDNMGFEWATFTKENAIELIMPGGSFDIDNIPTITTIELTGSAIGIDYDSRARACKNPGSKQQISSLSSVIFMYLRICVYEGIIDRVDLYGPFRNGKYIYSMCWGYNTCKAIIYQKGSNGSGEYSGKLLEQTSNRVTIQGKKNAAPSEVINLTPMNSPTIYLENSPKGKVNIKINSEFEKYANQKPDFNQKAGWKVESDGKNISVNNKETDNLFYELGLKKVNLSRNGKNFNSQEDLEKFLETSKFFNKLGLNEVEKENSLKYVLPRLPEAKNYYLTILENPETVTQLEVTPKAKIIQKYFVIYPTTIPVKTFGELVYPEKVSDTEEFVVKNYGEIIVKPEMFVIWE